MGENRLELLIAAVIGVLLGIITGIVLGYGPVYTAIWTLIGAVVVGELLIGSGLSVSDALPWPFPNAAFDKYQCADCDLVAEIISLGQCLAVTPSPSNPLAAQP
jgi:hypothetical protein